ncbi:MAG: hypothetical protein DMG72_06645 [Acidobacteria bacterium]|nr:MAG: hypothetical protein DMG72_06645 [Acidobacteriota bacterium]
MSAVEVVEAILAAGGVLALNGNRIHYQIPAQAAALLDELRCHRADVLHLLRQRKQRKAFAHLLPFLGKRVWSPAGPGKLLVVKDYVTVGLEDGTGCAGTTPRRSSRMPEGNTPLPR